ncbi:MAG: CHASE2 domain-containing protein [Microcoleaceae cyanobacterium MO_207.B10]|nr:CHASE2 domain-containing protein [Microcoleaceae cyanobacterium MO_207.B10]
MFKLSGRHQNKNLENVKRWLLENSRVLLTASTSAGMVILLRSLGLLQPLEWGIYDLFFRLRPPESLDPRIVIVGINEKDLQEYRYPINDRDLAKLLQKLQSFQPRVIGLDIYRDLPQEPGHKDLVAAFNNIPNLIGIEKLETKQNLGVRPPVVLSEKNQVGFNNVINDADGKIRRGLLYIHNESGKYRESFALKLALVYLKSEEIEPKAAANSDYLQLGKAIFHRFKRNDGAYIRADDKGYQFLANPRGIIDSFTVVSMRDVLSDKVSPNLIKDRVVMIGYTAISLKDFHYNSYSSRLFTSPEQISGVEMQAHFLSQILSSAIYGRSDIKVWPEYIEWLWIIIFSWVGASLSWQFRLPKKSIFTIVLIGSGIIGISYIAFIWNGWWLPVIPPIISLSGSAVMIMFYLAHLQEEWQRSTEFLQSVINAIPDPIFVKDKHHRRIVLNQAYSKFMGHPLEDLLIKTDYELFPQNEADMFWQQDELVFQTSQEQENEESFTNAKGVTHIIATKRYLHQDAAGNLFLVGVIRDITARKKMEEQLKETAAKLELDNANLKRLGDNLHHQAHHDPLTGLPNRKQFLECLRQAIEWADLNEQTVGLLFLDLNGFKAVNDTLGHTIGDLLLKQVAGRLNGCLRGSDTVSRLGGDEFTVILPGIPGELGASRVANKIRHTIDQPFELEGHIVSVSTSIGIALYPLNAQGIDTLINHADAAMYQEKKHHKKQR